MAVCFAAAVMVAHWPVVLALSWLVDHSLREVDVAFGSVDDLLGPSPGIVRSLIALKSRHGVIRSNALVGPGSWASGSPPPLTSRGALPPV